MRIVGLADAYDAMASNRIYRRPMQASEALQELRREAKDTFGADLVQSFIRCVGIYPPGTAVRLNTGAVGLVVGSREESRLKPLVLLVLDKEGRHLHPHQLVDLAHLEEKTGRNWLIDQTVDPNDYGLDIAALMQEEEKFRSA